MQHKQAQRENGPVPTINEVQERLLLAIRNALKDGRESIGFGKRTVQLRLTDICQADGYGQITGAMTRLMGFKLELDRPDDHGHTSMRALFTAIDMPEAYNPETYLKIQMLTEVAEELMQNGLNFTVEKPYDLFVDALEEYAREKHLDVGKGRETPELAAVKLEVYGLGLAKAMLLTSCLGQNLFIAGLDVFLKTLDPDCLANKKYRKDDRPTGLAGYSSSMLIME